MSESQADRQKVPVPQTCYCKMSVIGKSLVKKIRISNIKRYSKCPSYGLLLARSFFVRLHLSLRPQCTMIYVGWEKG